MSKTKKKNDYPLISYVIYCFCTLEEVYEFPGHEADRTSLPEDTVHMQELRRLHINDDHHRAHYRHPPGQGTIQLQLQLLISVAIGLDKIGTAKCLQKQLL